MRAAVLLLQRLPPQPPVMSPPFLPLQLGWMRLMSLGTQKNPPKREFGALLRPDEA